MEELVYSTAAYKIFCGDIAGGKLSHAYMLHFSDEYNLRGALKLFALKFFGETFQTRGGRLIMSEGLTDLKVYPQPEKKLTAEAATAIVEDAALRPLEYDKKLYIIDGFHNASPIFQNKLLKSLEEPPRGVYFLLGAASLAPVLDTVKSRVKMLEIPPFPPQEIYAALKRQGDNPLNRRASEDCGGVLGTAQNMLGGGWYLETVNAAKAICSASTRAKAVAAANAYGDFKYKKELLCEMQRMYFGELKRYAEDGEHVGNLSQGALIYAVESLNKAFSDLKFNANFSSLLFDFLLRVAERNGKA